LFYDVFFYFYFFADDSFGNINLFLLDLTGICTKWLVFLLLFVPDKKFCGVEIRNPTK